MMTTWAGFVVFLCAYSTLVTSSITPDGALKQKYSFSFSLDEEENYWMFWSVDHVTGSISIAVQVNTPGWVGMGLSPNGRMPDSDIVTGWVKDGKGFLQDRYSTAKSLPPIDESQDVELMGSSETNQITVLQFKRKLQACDEKDRSIEIGTSRVIWAYHQEDPESPDTLKMHQKMGWRSVNLLSGKVGEGVPLPADVQYFDVKTDKVAIPASETTYWCKSFTLPKIPAGADIVAVEPVIQKGNEGFVHHIIAYQCNNISGFHLEHDGVCDANMPDQVAECVGSVPMAGWAIGGKEKRYPIDVGYPFGGNSGLYTVVMEMHYDNPDKLAGLTDSSGLRFHYTMTPRKNKAGLIPIGHRVGPKSMFLAPGEKKIEVANLCPSECTQAGIPAEGLTVFSSLLHTHTAGTALWLEHYRNGSRLPDIDRNNNYDFNYQDSVAPIRKTKIYPGDILKTVCQYNTEGRSKFTFGGLATEEEMCLVYLSVYPVSKLRSCHSRIPSINETKFFTDAFTNGWAIYKGSSRSQLVEGINTLNLSIPAARAAYNDFWAAPAREVFCRSEDTAIVSWGKEFSLPVGMKPLPTDPPKVCDTKTTTTPAYTSGSRSLKAFSLFVFVSSLLAGSFV